MPTIYLSPSTQEFNPYYDGIGNEKYYMNLIADTLVPYLNASGISYIRNTPDMTAASSIRASNAGNFDLHIALHSNAAPPNLSGQLTGSDVYFASESVQGKRLADIIANNLKLIYYNPVDVFSMPTNSIGEVTRTRAPSALIEFAYHDNPTDAEWIRNNIDAIGRNVATSITEYLGIPLIEPTQWRTATVDTDGSALNIRSGPSLSAPPISQAGDGEQLIIIGSTDGWYEVLYEGLNGYTKAEYVVLNY